MCAKPFAHAEAWEVAFCRADGGALGSVAGLVVLAAGCEAFSSAFLAPALRAPSAACSSPAVAGASARGRARGMGLRMQQGVDIPVSDATCNHLLLTWVHVPSSALTGTSSC